MKRSYSFNRSIDSLPIQKAHEIYSGVYGRKIKLSPSDDGVSRTDCVSYIWLDFNRAVYRRVMYYLRTEPDTNFNVYLLSCDHEFRGQQAGTQYKQNTPVPCVDCGADSVYGTLEHEWSHIIFRSDPILYERFTDAYIAVLFKRYSNLAGTNLKQFLSLVINAFDDIRVNSLLGYVYAGSASFNWDRWKELCDANQGLNSNFIALIFGVFLDSSMVSYTNGPFSALIPEIKKATEAVQGKGPGNMLAIVRNFLDNCIDTLVDPFKKKQQNSNSQQTQQAQQRQPQPNAGGGGNGQQQQQQQDNQDQSGSGSNADEMQKRMDAAAKRAEQQSQQDQSKESKKGGAAIRKMANGAEKIDPTEAHEDINTDGPGRKFTQLPPKEQRNLDNITSHALRADMDQIPDTVDIPMQIAVDTLKTATRQKDDDGIVEGVSADVGIVDVKPDEMDKVILSANDKIAIARMRASFAQILGKKNTVLDEEGIMVDIESAIEHLSDPSMLDMFETESLYKGFSYLVLMDMSSSMMTDFQTVCRGAEILKRALDYPFVNGNIWGFRGTGLGRSSNNVNCVLFRYDKECRGYSGSTSSKYGKVDVGPQGMTPLNGALHAAMRHMQLRVSSGAAKRIFLLTDGEPTSFVYQKSGGKKKGAKDWVRDEIRIGRQKGIETFSFLIGSGISDESAKRMFGDRRNWERVNGAEVENALLKVVLKNFVRYLKE